MTTPAATAPVTEVSPPQAPGPPTIGQDGCPIRAFAFSSGGIGTAMHLGVAHALLVIQGKPRDAAIGISAGAISAASTRAATRWPCGRTLSRRGELRDVSPSPHSHSIVAGGFELTSYTTRFTPSTSLAIRLDTRASTSGGKGNQSAVIPSRLVTARSAIT
jgi:hypothetical protein